MKKNVFKPAALSALIGLSAMMAVGTANAGDAPNTMNQDAFSLLQAVEIAQNTTGGVALEADRDMEHGQAVYEIELVGKDGMDIKAVINASNGEVIKTKSRRDHDGDDHDDDMTDAEWMSHINNGTFMSLEQAVKQAEAEFGGKAYSAEHDDDHGRTSYEIKLVDANGKRVEKHLDANIAK
ncbi:PepSY domain-containing protein [Enterovibrio paralichthyis]|uniref:PepSY domain-containing protein n=1 Tax=Enterovibrio paralichthyis TaxID=2853805 RepID=UPI001C4575C9|nr:PepSY domain-containing protein [Enterovibrio paralichthyis]MBV7297212.1 PepSY domain-containing protein [Enterovibrio paralichthyis]